MAVTLHRIHLRNDQTLSSPLNEIGNGVKCATKPMWLLTYRRSTVVVTVVNVVERPGIEKSAQILMTTSLIGLVNQQQRSTAQQHLSTMVVASKASRAVGCG